MGDGDAQIKSFIADENIRACAFDGISHHCHVDELLYDA